MADGRNPFVTSRPVLGDDLCGREPALEGLVGTAPEGGLRVVTGEPGSGFTSVARELASRWRDEGRPVARIDVSLAGDGEEVAALFERALRGEGAASPPALLVDGVGRLGESPPLGEALEAVSAGPVVLLGPGAEAAVPGGRRAASAVVVLERIPYAAWLPYALERFLRTDRWIGDLHVAGSVERTGGHARRTPALLAEVWDRAGEGRPGEQTVERAWEALLGRSAGDVFELLAGLTINQRRVLRGLAIEAATGGEVRPYASDFLRRHRLTSPSSVQRCVQSLRERWLVRKGERGTVVRDPLLAAWLRRWPERSVEVE